MPSRLSPVRKRRSGEQTSRRVKKYRLASSFGIRPSPTYRTFSNPSPNFLLPRTDQGTAAQTANAVHFGLSGITIRNKRSIRRVSTDSPTTSLTASCTVDCAGFSLWVLRRLRFFWRLSKLFQTWAALLASSGPRCVCVAARKSRKHTERRVCTERRGTGRRLWARQLSFVCMP